MFRRLAAPLVIICTLALTGLIQPLVDKAHAATGNEPLTNQSSALGTADSGKVPDAQSKGYGPTDQNAPLDFSTQPASVPHQYAGGRTYNVQVYTKYSYAQLLGQMNYFAKSLGVGCQYCHNLKNFAYDTPTKKIARTMAIMSSAVNTNYIDPVHKKYPNYAVSGAVGCATCHNGNPHMDVKYNVVPVQYLDYNHKSTKQVGYAVNSMYGAARSLGVNCLFCHNTADFITLQYYPTNKIAHTMWAMVDDINHKYLPANIKAVTCWTCHQGNKWPSALVAAGLDQSPVEPIAAHPEVHSNPGAHLDAGVR